MDVSQIFDHENVVNVGLAPPITPRSAHRSKPEVYFLDEGKAAIGFGRVAIFADLHPGRGKSKRQPQKKTPRALSMSLKPRNSNYL
jgi:hypothetical protein